MQICCKITENNWNRSWFATFYVFMSVFISLSNKIFAVEIYFFKDFIKFDSQPNKLDNYKQFVGTSASITAIKNKFLKSTKSLKLLGC